MILNSKNKKQKSLLKNLKQISFFPQHNTEFGGSLLKNKRKSERILAFKKPLHVVIRGSIKISGSLVKYRQQIKTEIEKFAARFSIKIYNCAINFDHIHFNLRLSTRENYKKFIRALTGRIAQITKIKFTLRPYTKVLSWGREFKNFIAYTLQNHEEAIGLRPYQARKRRKTPS